MFEALELGIGLEVVRGFQTLRFAGLDTLALLFHYANDGLFYVVVIGAIYWMFNKRLGTRMFFALIMVGLVTILLKDIFARPRPYQILGGGIIPLVTETTYGIPSGHASITLVVWGYVALWMKRRPITILVMLYVFLMGLSRMYLGVHFPQDVLAGWLLGGILLLLYARSVEPIVAWWHHQSLVIQVALPLTIGAVMALFFIGSIDGLTLVGLLVGLSLAVIIETRWIHFSPKDSWRLRLAQFAIGILIAVVILEGLDVVFDAIEPPTYQYVESNNQSISALQASLEVPSNDATTVCIRATEAGMDELVATGCQLTVTPLAGVLRVVRYGLLALFAVSLIPLLSIRLHLMKQTETT